jgi:hypothetical protein
LDKLVQDCDKFPHTEKYFGDSKPVKGIFPYDYFTHAGVFSEISLPPREMFLSSLNDKNITEREYQCAIDTWNKFSCETFGDYHDLYLRLDVLLLTDIFEQFRTTSLKECRLDPAYYFSLPGLSWDAMLLHTDVKLSLLTDIDMYQFIEKSLRGGVSIITKKYAHANNKYLTDYDPSQESNFILYLDMNNQYGTAMSMPMPYGGFKFISSEEFLTATVEDWATLEDLSTIKLSPMNDKTCYFVECYIDYPARLHDAHNDYPYLPESMVITDEMLSPEQLALRIVNYHPIYKLVPNLYNKQRYICHYSLLKQALDAGLILKKVHRVLQFNHSLWLKPYIEINTQRRIAAKSEFEKNFFKLMINSIYGKTLENIRKRKNVEIVNNAQRRNKIVRSDCFQHEQRISENLLLMSKKPSVLKLIKPIYVGAAILDLSKTLMYDFHYTTIKKDYPGAELLFTDTDSLVYDIPGDDIYQFIYDNHRDLFDLSDSVIKKFQDDTNKKVLGKFKDEFKFVPVREFVGLRSKMYALITDDFEIKRAKGVNNNHVKNKLTFKDCLEALYRTSDVSIKTITSYGFRSYNHEIVT